MASSGECQGKKNHGCQDLPFEVSINRGGGDDRDVPKPPGVEKKGGDHQALAGLCLAPNPTGTGLFLFRTEPALLTNVRPERSFGEPNGALLRCPASETNGGGL